MTPKRPVVVVDGSNLATEGRRTPSLQQLVAAVSAFKAEHPTATLIVVVDATFEHRIAAEERARFAAAELAGDYVTPPAGVIGRGDAFILAIASRADAAVLSNDSFQEFHGEHPWLFDEGRLIGGKPIPHIGWIFTPRLPVRGARSRAASATKAPKATRGAAKAPAPTAKAPATASTPAGTGAHAVAKTPAKATPAAKAARTTGPAAARGAKGGTTKAPATPREARPSREPKAKAAKAPSRAPRSAAAAGTAAKAPAAKASRTTRPSRSKAAKATERSPERSSEKLERSSDRSGARTAKAAPGPARALVRQASASPRGATAKDSGPVNTARAFNAFTSRLSVRSKVDGVVESFTSHGAMVVVTVGRSTKVTCYVPLSGLGTPAPRRARDVLKLGETRTFRISKFDADRRIAELALA